MILDNLTFVQFCSLNQEERELYQEAYLSIEPFDCVDCETWHWGDVKEVQDILAGQMNQGDVLAIAKKECRYLNQNSQAHIIYSAFNAIKNSIKKISEAESKEWASPITPKQEQALADVGGFDVFRSIPQTLHLAKLLGISYNEVLKQPWDLCFAVYSYDVRFAAYNALILKP